MFSDYDEFADSICRNLAKSVYLICGRNYNSKEPISFNHLIKSFKRANDLEKKILNILYGTVGLIRYDNKTDVI